MKNIKIAKKIASHFIKDTTKGLLDTKNAAIFTGVAFGYNTLFKDDSTVKDTIKTGVAMHCLNSCIYGAFDTFMDIPEIRDEAENEAKNED